MCVWGMWKNKGIKFVFPSTLPFIQLCVDWERSRKEEIEGAIWVEREPMRETEMMQWEVSLMCEQHGRQPDTWGHFHFYCQLWQSAISTAEENISHSFACTHFYPSTLHPSQIVLLLFQVPEQYAIRSKLKISSFAQSWKGLQMDF